MKDNLSIFLVLVVVILILYFLKVLSFKIGVENFYNMGNQWNHQNGLPIGADFAVTNSNARAWISQQRGPIHSKKALGVQANQFYTGEARKIDELRRASQHGWLPKEQLGHLSTYYDQQRFYQVGELCHTTNEEFRLALWGEMNPDQCTYHYLVKKGGGCSGSPETIPLELDKMLDEGDMITIPGYSGRFRAYIFSLPHPHTFQANVIGSRGGPIPFKTSYCSS